MEDICNEQPPPEMTEMACEALTEELQQVQVKQYEQIPCPLCLEANPILDFWG